MSLLGASSAYPSRRRRVSNVVAGVLIGLATLVVLVPLFLVLYYLIIEGLPAFTLELFMIPQGGDLIGRIGHAIIGTGMLLMIATAIGATLGVGAGIFIVEYDTHPLVAPVRVMADVLLGVPAIVMGLVAYGLLVVGGGYSAWSGGVALGFIMIPYVVRATEEVLKLVPTSTREAGYALGIPKWRVILFIVLPAALSGVITGTLLAIARVAGEAAPLLFTAFGNTFLNLDPNGPVMALPLLVFRYARDPRPELQQTAWATALLLVLLVLVTTLITRYVFRRRIPR